MFLCPESSAILTKCFYIFRKNEHAVCVYVSVCVHGVSVPPVDIIIINQIAYKMGYFSTVLLFFLAHYFIYIIFISFGYKYVCGTLTLAGVYYSFYLLLANSFSSHNQLNPHARPIYACFHFIAYIRLTLNVSNSAHRERKRIKKRRVSEKIA